MTESVKKSVRLTAETIEAIRQVSQGNEINWSGSINDISSRYLLFVDNNLPTLTENEKLALATGFNGKLFDPKNLKREVEMLAFHIGASIENDGQVAEFLWRDSELDLDAFLKSDALDNFYQRVKRWTTSERLAVIHYVTAFWSPKLISIEDDEGDHG